MNPSLCISFACYASLCVCDGAGGAALDPDDVWAAAACAEQGEEDQDGDCIDTG